VGGVGKEKKPTTDFGGPGAGWGGDRKKRGGTRVESKRGKGRYSGSNLGNKG